MNDTGSSEGAALESLGYVAVHADSELLSAFVLKIYIYGGIFKD